MDVFLGSRPGGRLFALSMIAGAAVLSGGCSTNTAGTCIAGVDCVVGQVPCFAVIDCLDGNACQQASCAGNFCVYTPIENSEGMRCGGGMLCDAEGACVVDAACEENLGEQSDPAMGCGGPYCSPCDTGGTCIKDSDCQSERCAGMEGAKTCQAPACDDGKVNGGETGKIDDSNECGGPDCIPCPNDKACQRHSDCQSGWCVDFVCVTGSCGNSMLEKPPEACDHSAPASAANPLMLCEGETCLLKESSACQGNSQCASGICEDGECKAASCNDGVRNGTESGVDCGGMSSGAACPKCSAGSPCRKGDCDADAGFVCSEDGYCIESHCSNKMLDPIDGETDIDCGGEACPKCDVDQNCSLDGDCKTGKCVEGICTTCGDGIKNGDETDMDCGGSCTMKCANGRECGTNGDNCQSGVCTDGRCQKPSCYDGVLNGDETSATDCDSPLCGPCFDCSSGITVPQAECEALVSFFRATNGVSWQDKSATPSWLDDKALCSWGGTTGNEPIVSCGASNAHIIGIKAPANAGSPAINGISGNVDDILAVLGPIPLETLDLSGVAPTDSNEAVPFSSNIGVFSDLRTLNLANTRLAGQIPVELTTLTGLEVLRLGPNIRIAGPIPPSIDKLNALRVLSAHTTGLEGAIPLPLFNIATLEDLDLSGNGMLSGTIAPEIAKLSALRFLNLNRTGLEGTLPPEIGSLSNLVYLALSGAAFDGTLPPELGSLSSLQQLHLDGNMFSGEIPATITNLSSLNIAGLCDESAPTNTYFSDISTGNFLRSINSDWPAIDRCN